MILDVLLYHLDLDSTFCGTFGVECMMFVILRLDPWLPFFSHGFSGKPAE